SPGPMPLAISTISNASVPLAQLTTCLAPENSASSFSSCVTSGPLTNWQCVSTRPPPRRAERRAEPAALRADIDERDGFNRGVLVHDAFNKQNCRMGESL